MVSERERRDEHEHARAGRRSSARATACTGSTVRSRTSPTALSIAFAASVVQSLMSSSRRGLGGAAYMAEAAQPGRGSAARVQGSVCASSTRQSDAASTYTTYDRARRNTATTTGRRRRCRYPTAPVPSDRRGRRHEHAPARSRRAAGRARTAAVRGRRAAGQAACPPVARGPPDRGRARRPIARRSPSDAGAARTRRALRADPGVVPVPPAAPVTRPDRRLGARRRWRGRRGRGPTGPWTLGRRAGRGPRRGAVGREARSRRSRRSEAPVVDRGAYAACVGVTSPNASVAGRDVAELDRVRRRPRCRPRRGASAAVDALRVRSPPGGCAASATTPAIDRRGGADRDQHAPGRAAARRARPRELVGRRDRARPATRRELVAPAPAGRGGEQVAGPGELARVAAALGRGVDQRRRPRRA